MALTDITTTQFINTQLIGDTHTPSVNVTVSLSKNHHGHDCYIPNKIDIQHPMIPLTSTQVKKLSIHRQLIPHIVQALLNDPANAHLASHQRIKAYSQQRPGRAVGDKAAHSPTAKHLEEAAAVYILARLSRDAAIYAIAKTFQISHVQATQWAKIIKQQWFAE